MSESRLFYGWVIVAVTFVVDFIAVGFFFYSYGAFFLPIAEELGGGSRFGVNMGIALVNVAAATLAPFIGNALDRHSIKHIMTAGAIMSAIGFALLSFVNSMPQFYLILVCFTAVGTATMGQLATAKLVANWFVVKRGTALGIATMGTSLAGVVMPRVTTWLIEELGWRGSLQVFSISTLLIVVPLVLFFVVNDPEVKGLQPDGKRRLPLPVGPPRARPPQPGWLDILRMRSFWAVTVTFGLLFCAMSATLTNTIPLGRDLGIDKYHAADLLAIGAFAGVIGKVFFGVLSDRANIRLALLLATATQWIGIAMLTQVQQFWTFAVASSIFGFGMGGVVPMHASVVGEFFGRQGFGKMMGLMRPMMLPLQVAGLPLAGWIYDRTGSYNGAFYVFLTMLLVAALLTMFMLPRERRGE